MKRFLLLLAFMFSCEGVAYAQPTQAQWDAMVARQRADSIHMALLDSILGTKGFLGPQIACKDMEAARPTWYFPNGEYNISYRQKQLGCGTNDLANHVAVSDVAVIGFNAKMPPSGRSVTEYVNSAIAAIPPSSGGGESTVQLPNLGKGLTMRDANTPGSAGAVFFASGEDATRLLTNHIAYWPPPATGKNVIRHLAILRFETESDCKWEMGYEKRSDVANGTWDASEGKDLIFQIGGQNTECGPRGKYVQLAGGIVGRGIEIGVVNDGGTPNVPSYRIRIDPDGSPDPVSLFVAGSYKRVRSCNIGGVNVFCY